MYARLISFSGADPEKRESAIEMIRGTVIPMLQSYDGFAGYLSLYDQDERRAKAIILWENKDSADAAEETLAERDRVDHVDDRWAIAPGHPTFGDDAVVERHERYWVVSSAPGG